MAPLLTTPLTRRAAIGSTVATLALGVAPATAAPPREIPIVTVWEHGSVSASAPALLTMLASTFAHEDGTDCQQLLRDAADLLDRMSVDQIRAEVAAREKRAGAA